MARVEADGVVGGGKNDSLDASFPRFLEQIVATNDVGIEDGLPWPFDGEPAEVHDTVDAFDALGLEQDTRSYDAAVLLLRRLSISRVRLITNNPRKLRYLQQHDVDVTMVNTHPTVRPRDQRHVVSGCSRDTACVGLVVA